MIRIDAVCKKAKCCNLFSMIYYDKNIRHYCHLIEPDIDQTKDERVEFLSPDCPYIEAHAVEQPC